MPLYWFPDAESDRELAQRAGVARPVQPVQHALGARGEHLAAHRRVVDVIRRWFHGAHSAQPIGCASSEIRSEISSEGGAR